MDPSEATSLFVLVFCLIQLNPGDSTWSQSTQKFGSVPNLEMKENI